MNLAAPRVDADIVRTHINALRSAGMGYKRIGLHAGVCSSTMQRILYGLDGGKPSRTCSHDIAARIFSVQVDLDPNRAINSAGTVRRAQALIALGHPVTDVARAIGWSLKNLSALLGGHRWGKVYVRTARTVADGYDRLSMIRPDGPDADRARAHARSRGWFPPLAWDDDTIDDPAAVPCLAPLVDGSNPDVDELVVQHAVAGHPADLDADTKAEVTWRLFATGYDREQIAAVLRTTPKYVDHLRQRARKTARAATTSEVAA